jgi:hypothetical protein
MRQKRTGGQNIEYQNGPDPLMSPQLLPFTIRRFIAFSEGVGKLQSPYGLHPFPHSLSTGLAPRPLEKT